MKLKQMILRFLIENKDKEYSIMEISKALKVDYKNTYDAVNRLKTSVSMEKKSNSRIIRFSPVLTEDIYIVENMRFNDIIKNKSIGLISNDLKGIDDPFFSAILFGSYAKGKNKKNSDIDICIIHDNDENFKNIYSVLSVHPLIEIHEFSYQEFISMLKDKSFNVGHEIVRDGIILHGIEPYYEMIKYE